MAEATVIAREPAVLCGTDWFYEVFRQMENQVKIDWFKKDGDDLETGETVCKLQASAQLLLIGERTALNFLQILSGTATLTRKFVDAIAPYKTRILDTRKTIPGLRIAQKYAVSIGGGVNHRFGLYDGILIKENHQYITQSLDEIFDQIRTDLPSNFLIEVEIESLDQLEKALQSGANRIMLDNFSVEDVTTAVEITNGRVALEASGNVDYKNVVNFAKTGVDFISIGAITKNLRAIDFSMLFEKDEMKKLFKSRTL